MAKMNALLLAVIELILLLVLLSAVTPTVFDFMTRLANGSAILNATGDVLGHSQPLIRLMLPTSLGGILWFVLCILIIVGVIFATLKSKGKGGY